MISDICLKIDYQNYEEIKKPSSKCLLCFFKLCKGRCIS